MNKREIISFGMSLLAVALWFGQNIYFGWNKTPESIWEAIADFMVYAIWIVAYFVKPSRLEVTNNNITTDNIQFISPKLDSVKFPK